MRRGFTLIELLAVIVILAIISSIAVPIIINIIEDAKRSSAMRSVELYYDSVSNSLYDYNLKNSTSIEGICVVQKNGNLRCSNVPQEIEIPIKKQAPNCGLIYVSKTGIQNIESLIVDSYSFKKEKGKSFVFEEDNTCFFGEDKPIIYFNDYLLDNNNISDEENINFRKASPYYINYHQITSSNEEYVFDRAKNQYTYYFGPDYSFDTETGKYTIVGGEKQSLLNSNGSLTSHGNYKYVCATSQMTSSCVTMFELGRLEKFTDSEDNTVKVKVVGEKYESRSYTKLVNGEGLIEHNLDNGETTYYFRGEVDNNYVQIGDYVFRIVRINEDGSIRLVLNGDIGNSAFNTSVDNNAYVGYMYGNTNVGNGTDEEKRSITHSNMYSSTIKETVDNWYKNSFIQYDDYLADSGFCGDRKVFSELGSKYELFDNKNSSYDMWKSNGVDMVDSGKGYGTNTTFYGAFYRVTNGDPSFECKKKDLYTVNNEKGNQALKYKVGLMSVDEAIFAGGALERSNILYYLYYDNKPWWTMSPFAQITDEINRTAIFAGIDGIYYAHASDAGSRYVRPVINLKSNIIYYKGDGTEENPYKVVYLGDLQ